MKKTLVTLACLLVLCASIGNGLRILEVRPVLADTNNASYLEARMPLENHGPPLPRSNISSFLSPTQIRTAYNLPSTGGSGTIAIIDAYHDPTIQDDLGNFSAAFGLPPPNATNFEQHMMAQYIPSDEVWSIETSLDVEWAHAIAPNAKILLVEAASGEFPYVLPAIDYAANRSDVVAISMSWDWTEQVGPFSLQYSNGTIVPVPFANESLYDSHFTSPYGAAFFAASGDNAENVSWPAVSRNVVGVGGTNLTMTIYDAFVSETVWNDGNGNATGGGVSAYETEPSYQTSYGVQGSNGMRGVPDVSFDAGTPVDLYDSFANSTDPWWQVGGTSLGAPCWAAIYSLKHTALNPVLYNLSTSVYNSSCFRDITVGSNGNYNATAGYDFCTGLGSPLTGAFNSSLLGDVNLDGKVNILDAIPVGEAFGSTPGSPNWNALADINNDGTVNILDAIILGSNFGKTYANGTTSGTSGQSSSVGTMATGGPSVLVDPSQISVFKGDSFTVNVDVENVTDLYGWEFQLYWNNTVLNCTNAVVQTPTEWQNNSKTYGSGLEENFNSTNGLYWIGQSATYPASSFNGSMTIATLTFQALQPGTTSLTLTDTVLGDSADQPITCTASSGTVTVYSGRYMRSDTQTINGLGAYALNVPESTSSASVTQVGVGSGYSWGIRAFVRHSDGTEQEISLDGQTGTLKAAVSGGNGLQSATVAVSQKGLQQTDSLVIRVYASVGASGWTLEATFTTEQLQATTLQAATWTVYYYITGTYNHHFNITSSTFYWGTTTYDSRIQNLLYT